jgi:alanine racemase
VRPSWVEVDLEAIRHNVAAIAAEVAPSRVCVVVKADGYGHGDVPVAEAAVDAGASHVAVALVSEGIGLREGGVDAPVLVLSEPDPADAAEIVRWRLTPTVYTGGFIAALESRAPAGFPVHLKVDTGMHRIGASPEDAPALAARIDEGSLAFEGLWTHFAAAEDDPDFTKVQLAMLEELTERLRRAGIEPGSLHAANTAAALGLPETRLDMVRIGLGAYGLYPVAGPSAVDLIPAMRVVSRVTRVARLPEGSRPSYGRRRPLERESTVVTVPVGYADGLLRSLSTSGGALIGGRRHPFAGTITMDQALVDVGDHPVAVGDEVVFLGRQEDVEISAYEWADLLGTITWEIVCGFGPRLPRRYLG